ncbi:MAG: hypothetical protein SWY16_10540 [Cyanobacteriota bacterium]|nr:hypothetical protein [Cyanobacteriota bacterium]
MYSLTPIVQKILASGQITFADREALAAAARSEDPIAVKEQVEIRKVFELLQKGFLQVLD